MEKRWFKPESFILVFIMTLTILTVCWDATANPLDPEKREYFMYAPWGKKVYFGVISNEFVVQFKEGVIQEQIENLNTKYQTEILKTVSKDGNRAPIYLLRIPQERSLKDMLKPYSQDTRAEDNVYGYEPIVSWTMPVFHHLNTRIVPTDEFKVLLSSNTSENALMQLNQEHGVEIVMRDEKEPSYLLRVTEKSDLNSLDMANLYHEQLFIALAVPDYLSNQEIEDPEARQYFWYEMTPPTLLPTLLEVSSDEFVVQFKQGVTDAQIDALNAKYNIQIIRKFSRGIDGMTYIFSMPPGKRLKDVLKLCGKQQAPHPDIYGYEEIVEWTMPSFYSHGKRFIPKNSFSVVLKPGVDGSVLREFNRKHGVVENTIRSYNLRIGRVYVLMATEESDLNSLDMANLYHEQPFTQWAEPNYGSEGLYSLPPDYPNDYYYRQYPQQWNLNQESDIDIDAPEAWRIWDNIGDGKGWGITIAIVDTGIEMYHEDLAGKLLTPDEDFVTWDGWPDDEDPGLHGTQVAGIAAAMTHNSVGIAGVAPNALIMPLRAIGPLGWDPEHVGQAIEFAYEHEARVINCSFGSPNNYSQVRHAVEDASAAGSVVVCAAGNDGTDEPRYPADYGTNPRSNDPYNIPGVIKVGAIDQNGNRWVGVGSSNLNPDVVAPQNVISTFYEFDPNKYHHFTATSAAAPHVSGLAALLLSYKLNLTPAQVKDIIQKTADDRGGAGYDQEYGYGLINAFRALQYLGGTIRVGQVREWKKERVSPQEFDILLAGDVVVEGGATPAILNIQPGTVIRFEPLDFQSSGKDITRPELIVSGVLTADGQTDNRIIFESATGGGQPWYGIRIEESSSFGSVLQSCTIKHAYIGIECSASPTINDCHISDNSYAGIRCNGINSQPTITNTEIMNNGNGTSVGGVSIEGNAQPNLGNLENTSTDDDGGNTFSGNWPPYYDIANYTPNDIYAQGNYWNQGDYWPSVSQADIDARIYDDGETQVQPTPSGKVEFWPVLDPNNGSIVDVFYGDINRNRRLSGGDAAMVCQYVVGLLTLDGDQQVRAEVSGNGEITSGDASLISQRVVGLIDHFPIEEIPKAPSDKTDENTYIVRITNGFANGNKIQLPITVDDATGVFAGYFEVQYNSSLIKGINVVKGALISEEGFLLSDELFQFNILPGSIKLVFGGLKTLQRGGTIAFIEFQLLPKAFKSDEISILLSDGQFNESGKMVLVDGSIKLRPPEADLLENFPNPFNPDTWIPYQLSKPAQVVISIYNVQGQLIRTLDLGRKDAGYYTTKERAGYWDGRNAQGERVSSGVYFYTIKAGNFVATKKLAIVK